MNDEELLDLVNGKPEELIGEMAKHGYDFSDMSPDIAKNMVEQGYGLTENDFIAVDFVFWFAYFVERTAEDFIVNPEVAAGARRLAIEVLVKELSFGSKIQVLEELHLDKKDKLVKIMRDVQNYRNHVAHGRFDKLMYKGYHLSDNRGKLLLIGHLKNILLKK